MGSMPGFLTCTGSFVLAKGSTALVFKPSWITMISVGWTRFSTHRISEEGSSISRHWKGGFPLVFMRLSSAEALIPMSLFNPNVQRGSLQKSETRLHFCILNFQQTAMKAVYMNLSPCNCDIGKYFVESGLVCLYV